MEQILSHDQFPFMLMIVIMFSFFAFVMGAMSWCAHRRAERAVALARDMVKRGMSAAEIERVLRALPSDTLSSGSDENNAPAGAGRAVEPAAAAGSH